MGKNGLFKGRLAVRRAGSRWIADAPCVAPGQNNSAPVNARQVPPDKAGQDLTRSAFDFARP